MPAKPIDRYTLFRSVFPRDGYVVEIGSQRGVSASQIQRACHPRALFLVDAWRFLEGAYERDPANRPTKRRQAEKRECAERVGCHPNVVMIEALSQEAVGLFADESLDAVYLDADHTREGITRDLEAWLPKVKPGGVVSGHDYTTKLPAWVEVVPVVDGIVSRLGVELVVSQERAPGEIPRPHDDVDGCVFASWAFVKP